MLVLVIEKMENLLGLLSNGIVDSRVVLRTISEGQLARHILLKGNIISPRFGIKFTCDHIVHHSIEPIDDIGL